MKTKRVLEIKRGEPVPVTAKWLKDTLKVTGKREAPSGDGGWCSVDVAFMFDLYEIEDIYEEK